MMDFDIKLYAAAIALTGCLLPSAATANRSCPGGTVEMNGQCVVADNGGGGSPGNATATGGAGGSSSSDATAGAIGVGVGVGTGGNATTGPIDVTTGPNTATGGQGGHGGSVGDTTASSGSSSTATGGSAVADVSGSGNSSSRSGVSGSGNSNTTVNNTNKTRIKHAASMAAPVMTSGYGPGNCFGDTNPSGQFGASMQTFGWGVAANRSKASNVCAMVAIAGPTAALSYLANVDPNVRRALLANGLAEKPSQRKARLAAEAEDAPTKNARPAQTVRCPEGSTWDGKGCWAKNIKAVSR